MSGNERKTSGGRIGFIEALQLIFITLKLCKVIDWSWVLVLSPMELMLAVTLLAIAVKLIMKNK